METTEQSAGRLTISLPETPRELQLWLVDELIILAEAMGEVVTPERLRIYARDLSTDLSREQLQGALCRARRELKFFPKIAEIRELAGEGTKQQQDAEGRAAWDTVTKFVQKYVGNDVYGNYGPEHGWYPKRYPKLSDRILDTVRRTGGWRVYACLTDEDFPFVQKRFFEDYAAWTAVERILDTARLIEAVPEVKRLVAKSIDPPPIVTAVKSGRPVERRKLYIEPLTSVQIADRREMLRQQVELMRAKHTKP